MEKDTFCKVYEYEDRQILVQKEYNGDNETYSTKVTNKYFDALTKDKALEIFKKMRIIK